MTETIIETLGKPKRTRKPRTTMLATAPVITKTDSTKKVAIFGVAFMSIMSGLLNGYANSQHAPIAIAGWLMGLAIPVIVLVLGKVAGNKYKTRQMHMAWIAGGSGLGLLFLSVWHCSESIATLTGSGLVLAVPMAIAIDCGLVACELAIITDE